MDTLYDLLGALPSDDAEGLRAAFRRAAKGAHPDINPGDPDAGLRFRQIVRANEILADVEQRAAYDHLLDLARIEEEQAAKLAFADRVYRFASGVMALAALSAATVGGYALFLHLSANATSISGEVTDREMPQAPKWSVGGTARYAFPVGPGQLALSTDWKYDSSLYFSTFNAPIDRESSRIVGNARISWASDDDHWTLAAFVNNLTDKEYRIYDLDLGASFGFANQTYARPRWFGGSVGYSF